MSIPPRRRRSILTVAGVALLLVGIGPAHGSSPDEPPRGAWYVPREADFRAAYDRDAANGKAQTWEQYWGWVRTFYDGNILSAGWTQRMTGEVAPVSSASAREALIGRLNKVGVRIAQEWAKDDAVRKINTTDLKRWHAAIGVARSAEDGSGDQIKAAVRAVEDEVARKLRKP